MQYHWCLNPDSRGEWQMRAVEIQNWLLLESFLYDSCLTIHAPLTVSFYWSRVSFGIICFEQSTVRITQINTPIERLTFCPQEFLYLWPDDSGCNSFSCAVCIRSLAIGSHLPMRLVDRCQVLRVVSLNMPHSRHDLRTSKPVFLLCWAGWTHITVAPLCK